MHKFFTGGSTTPSRSKIDVDYLDNYVLYTFHKSEIFTFTNQSAIFCPHDARKALKIQEGVNYKTGTEHNQRSCAKRIKPETAVSVLPST